MVFEKDEIITARFRVFFLHYQKNRYMQGGYLGITRGVRGSDYRPATMLSEEKDKFVPEHWRDREKKSTDYTKTTSTTSFHAENICKVLKQLKENCKRSCTHKIPIVHTF